MKRITTSIILSLSISVAFTAAPTLAKSAPPNKHTHRMYHGVLSDYFYDTLSVCETGVIGSIIRVATQLSVLLKEPGNVGQILMMPEENLESTSSKLLTTLRTTDTPKMVSIKII